MSEVTEERTAGEKWADGMRVRLARDLRAVVKLCGDLREEIQYRADSKDIPGGTAMVLLGPSANPEAWNYREISAALGRTEAHGLDEIDSDPVPPLLVLATWEDAVRSELGTPTTKRATIKDAAKFLGASVDWMLDDDENGDMNFIAIDDLAADISKTRAMLENVLKAGNRNDTGAPCVDCGTPLVKVWRDAEEYDQWRCKPCDDDVTPERYKKAVHAGHLAYAKRLNASDMLAAYRIPVGTLQGWASKGLVKKRGKDQNGRVLYDVEQAKEQRDKVNAKAEMLTP